MAITARMPTMITTIIASMSVKPRRARRILFRVAPAVIVVMATAPGFFPGCVCSRGVPAEAHEDFGAYEAPPPDAKVLLALARAVLEKGPRSASEKGEGRGVMLSFGPGPSRGGRQGAEAIATTGRGEPVADRAPLAP